MPRMIEAFWYGVFWMGTFARRAVLSLVISASLLWSFPEYVDRLPTNPMVQLMVVLVVTYIVVHLIFWETNNQESGRYCQINKLPLSLFKDQIGSSSMLYVDCWEYALKKGIPLDALILRKEVHIYYDYRHWEDPITY